MPIYTVKGPDGRTYDVEGPEGATAEQLGLFITSQAKPDPTAQMKASARGSALSALNGLTFGFGDELVGLVSKGAQQSMRDQLASYRQANPGRAMASEMVGGVPFGVGLGRAIPALNSLPKQLAVGGAVGGATGAVTGAGESTATDGAGMAQDALQGGGAAMAMGAGLPIAARGAGMIGQQLMSRFMPEQAKQWAQEKVAQAFSRDGITGQQAATRLGALGPEARVVDAGRDSVRQTLDTLATAPGATKANVSSAIAERQMGRGGRMRGAAEDAFGVNGFRLAPEMETWMSQREAAAGPLYERVTRMTVQPNSALMGIISAADDIGATKLGQTIASARQQPWTLDPSGGQPMSMRDLDNLKKGIDQLVSKQTDPDGKLTPLGDAYNDLRKKLIENLDRSTMNQYKRARDAFAGPSAIMDAAQAGKRALLSDDQSIRSMMGGLSGSEKDAFALGAFEALRSKLGAQAGQTEMMKLWRQDGMKEKLRAIFGDEKAYLEFARKMYAEKTMAGLETVGRGSQTAARQQAAQDLDSPVGAAIDLARGNLMGGLRGLTSRMGTPEPVRDAMGNFLLSRNPQGLLELDPLIQSINKNRTQQAAFMGLLGGI